MESTPRLLIVSSCTGSKKWDPPGKLFEHDFTDKVIFRQKNHHLIRQGYVCSAREMYIGEHHRLVKDAVDLLRQHHIPTDLLIVSAGFGVIGEHKCIVPYDITFFRKKPTWIRNRAKVLGIPTKLRSRIQPYSLVFFLLGGDYLTAINPHLTPGKGQRFIFFAAPSNKKLPRNTPGITIVPAGQEENADYRANRNNLKGKMFLTLSRVIIRRPPKVLAALHRDDKPTTAQRLLAYGRSHP